MRTVIESLAMMDGYAALSDSPPRAHHRPAAEKRAGDFLSLFKKGLILIAIPLILQWAFIGLSLHIREERQEDHRWVARTKEVVQVPDNGIGYLGAASFIQKPVTFEALVKIVKTLGRYWLDIVELPGDPNAG